MGVIIKGPQCEVNSIPMFTKDQLIIPNFKTRVVPKSSSREPHYTNYRPNT